MGSDLKTTVYLDSTVYRRLKSLASADGRSAADLVREAVAEYAARRSPTVPARSIGAGHSGAGDLSERTDELLEGLGADR